MPDLTVTFRGGRADCDPATPYSDGNANLAQRKFPAPTMTAEEIFAYYASTDGPGFGFDWEEVGNQSETCKPLFLGTRRYIVTADLNMQVLYRKLL